MKQSQTREYARTPRQPRVRWSKWTVLRVMFGAVAIGLLTFVAVGISMAVLFPQLLD